MILVICDTSQAGKKLELFRLIFFMVTGNPVDGVREVGDTQNCFYV